MASPGYGRGIVVLALGLFLLAGRDTMNDIFAPLVTDKSPGALGQVGMNLVEAFTGEETRRTYMEDLSRGEKSVHMSFCHYEDVRNSKMLVALGLFFFNSFAQQNLLKTGAFEVYYNSTPVYSKLASGLGNQVDLNEMIKGLKVAMGVEE
ncbi:putative selenoprotein T [Chloropicon roscoffensis]|uniref:Selenoprotein T n=1 Tax=Chloropicon roscoffensis TaxID=1461544 RepID=A0AAX4P1H8_9CHLO